MIGGGHRAFGQLLANIPGKDIVVIGHARPDGDCIGSQVAVARVFRALGARTQCINPDPVPRRLQFLVTQEPFCTLDTLPEGNWEAIYVDCADQERAGLRLMARFPQPWLVFDHHLSNQTYGQNTFVDVSAAATCEILADLFLEANVPVDEHAAQALYVGILTDTGQFRFNSTTRQTFELAAELMARGANPVQAGHELYERETPGKIQLLQRFLASFRMECEGRVCIGLLPYGIFSETGTSPEDTEGMVDYARAIDRVDVGVLIEERPDGIKASLRGADPALRLDLVASEFGGGGHACAAGLSLPGANREEFCERLVTALRARLASADADHAVS